MKKLLAIILALLMLCGCVPVLPGDIESNSAEIKPGNEYIAAEMIYSAPLFSKAGASDAIITITEDALLYKHDAYTEEKRFPVEEWNWQEFPYTEEEWENLFESPEQVFDVFGYGKIMYRPVSEFVFLLLADGEIMLVNITMINSESHPLIVRDIERLIPADSLGRAKWEFAPAMSSKETFFDFEIRTDFSRIYASGTNLVDVDKAYFQLGNNIAIDDHDFIRWSAVDYDGVRSDFGEISFTIYQNGDNSSPVYEGRIMIEALESENGKTLYEAILISPDLMMETDENTGRVYIFDPDI